MQVVVNLFILRQSGVIRAITQTQNHLEIRHVHTSCQLSTSVSSLEKQNKNTHVHKRKVNVLN